MGRSKCLITHVVLNGVPTVKIDGPWNHKKPVREVKMDLSDSTVLDEKFTIKGDTYRIKIVTR